MNTTSEPRSTTREQKTMNKEEALQYYPLPWRCGDLEESSGETLCSILAANGNKVTFWSDHGAAQAIVDAVNKCYCREDLAK